MDNPFIGIPKCQDCGWKLHTDITDNCSCMGPMSPERDLKHKVAYNRAREIQAMSDNNLPTPENNLPEVIRLFPDVSTETTPTQVDSEGVTPEPQLCPATIDVGTVAWSKIPIGELSPQTWFAYEKNPVDLRCVVFDGNGRKLFTVEDEEIAAFAVKAMNVYVLAAMQTQTQL